MNKTILVCSIAALSLSVPAWADDQKSRGTAGHYSMNGSEVQRIDRTPSSSLSHLTDAAQRLREAIQQIAQHSSGDARDAAIRSAHQALFDTQQAMIDLPPELRRGGAEVGTNEQSYDRSMEKLKAAAQTLRESAQAMAQQPAGERRNQAVARVNEAILEINEAMVQLPWEGGHTADRTASPGDDGRQAGAAIRQSFDAIDSNRDGMLSRQEYGDHSRRNESEATGTTERHPSSQNVSQVSATEVDGQAAPRSAR